ncbi:hypothetical protein K0B96_02025 [Horticoccus luteus]|uniref:Uncharacterized protein n=1 Tax=Horticoccus luteus TaxID=2862869 RepID=A0A8F9XHK2_9BACT|nr:hypothetical protein [Horticoccus luteus]QYM79420.1 hypothetical protein K0B96_02025 [Horticoccus luteus]
MKTNLVRLAVTLGVAAVAAVLLVRSTVSVDSLVGFGAVIALIAGLATEYRLTAPRAGSR